MHEMYVTLNTIQLNRTNDNDINILYMNSYLRYHFFTGCFQEKFNNLLCENTENHIVGINHIISSYMLHGTLPIRTMDTDRESPCINVDY